jgi:hypothetical protein
LLDYRHALLQVCLSDSLLECRIAILLAIWPVRLLTSRLLARLPAVLPAYWLAGILACWSAGILAFQLAGITGFLPGSLLACQPACWPSRLLSLQRAGLPRALLTALLACRLLAFPLSCQPNLLTARWTASLLPSSPLHYHHVDLPAFWTSRLLACKLVFLNT